MKLSDSPVDVHRSPCWANTTRTSTAANSAATTNFASLEAKGDSIKRI